MLSLIALIGLVSAASTAIAVVYMCYMSAERSGWHQLATHFGRQGRFVEPKLHFASAVLNGFAFHGTLSLGADEDGLLMVPELPIRPFHPPLYLEWYKLSGRQFARTHSRGLELSLHDPVEEVPEFSLEIDDRLRAKLLALCHANWTEAVQTLENQDKDTQLP